MKQVIKMRKQLCLVLEDEFFFFNGREQLGQIIDFLDCGLKFELKWAFGSHLNVGIRAGL